MATKYSIRVAEEKDAGDILRLIKELAEFEKMADEVKIGTKELAENISSWFHCLLLEYRPSADMPTEIVGYAVWNYCYGTWCGRQAYMEDLYISPAHRGQGGGLSMMQSIAKICHKEGSTRLRWAVLGWNQLAKKLYSKINSENTSETLGEEMLHLEGENFERLAQSTPTIPFVSNLCIDQEKT